MAGISAGSGLSAGKGLTPQTGITLPNAAGLVFNGFDQEPTGDIGILLETDAFSFLMLEDGVSFLNQE